MTKSLPKVFSLTLILSIIVSLFAQFSFVQAAGSVSLTTFGAAYNQDFNTLVGTPDNGLFSTVPTGWEFSESGTNANTTYRVGTGSNTTGDTYSFGATNNTERAFGGLRSGTLIPLIGTQFTNDTGGIITSLDIAYTGEQWRLGQNTTGRAADRLDFQLSTNATSITTGTWADYNTLDFPSPVVAGTVGALNGNVSPNQTSLSFSITGLTIVNGANFWIRWADTDLIPGADDGLSVDDFNLTPNGVVPEPKINEFSASTAGTDVEFVEVFGTASTDYSAYKVLEIEGDTGLAVGTVDEVISLGTTNANGLLLVNLAANALENGTISLLLVKNFTGALNNDLDADNNGVFDTTPWEAIVDSVSVNDGGAGDVTFGVPSLGIAYDGAAFAPGGASRIPDGTDTHTTADWVRNDFDLAGIPGFAGTPVAGEALNTPGASNQAITVDSNTVTIEATDGDASEAGSATGNFRISRTGSTTAAITVNYTISGSASAADYTPVLGDTAQILAGASFVDILITPVDDGDIEGPETLTLTLATGSGYLLGATTSASVNIADNDVAVVITPIHDIQGTVDASNSGTFTVEAIVVGDYQTQGSGRLRGFFLQEEDADADVNAATSEGIFVFCTTCPVSVSVGDKLRVTGASSEFFGMTQLTASTAGSVSVLSSGNPLPMSATVELPVPGVPTGDLAAATTAINAYFEPFEGMLVTFPDTLSVSEYFELARYGQVILNEGGRPRQFTDANVPTELGYTNHQIDLAARTIILDDTDNRQNRPSDAPNTPYYHPVPGLSTGNFFRGGDTITNLTGVLHWSFAGQTGTDAWRIRPVTEAYSYAFTPVNTRPALPSVDGSLTVASFNVLNYFLTIDTSNNCAPTQDQDCRGADSAQELERQRTKMLAALSAIDADVFGFMEMENTPGVEPLADIVAGLPGYDYVDTGVIGTDAIRVGIIYKTSTVSPVGNFAVLDTQAFVNPRNADLDRNRPAVVQTFEEISTGARFTVVVNHLKSKGSGCGAGDDDTTTGQGNCNLTRTLAAQELADWLATDPTGSGDSDVLIIGDLNSNAKEDPIVALQSAGYSDMVAAFGGPSAYGYVFDGQLGYLDHALSNASLTPQVADLAEWHINADEIPLFDYNDDQRTADEAAFEEESDSLPLYEPNEFRTSDHDPVLIGLNLVNQPPTADAGGPYSVIEGGSVTLNATGADPEGTAVTFEWDLDNDDVFETSGQSVNFSAASITAPATLTVKVKVTDAFGNFAVDDTTVSVLYNFNGFFQPVDNLPTVNSVKAGQGIPVKFSLNGDHGLNIFAAGYPKLEFTSCPSASVDPVEMTVTAGSSSLSYDAATDQYTYIWKTDKNWAGKCGTLLVMFNDGTTQTALFTFTK